MGLSNAATDAADSGVLDWVKNWGKFGRDGHWTGDLNSGLSRFGIIGAI
ncbi:hypothetical protein ACFVUS_37110 [Nocardia sp. NPDC058058]